MTEDNQSMVEQAKAFTDSDDDVLIEDGDKVVDVYKCKVKQIGPVLGLLSNLLKDLGVLDIEDEQMLAQLEEKTRDPEYLLQLIAKYIDQIPGVASLLCSLSEEEFGDLELDDAFAVLMKIWEVNQSFFSQRILPMISKSEKPAVGSKGKQGGTP